MELVEDLAGMVGLRWVGTGCVEGRAMESEWTKHHDGGGVGWGSGWPRQILEAFGGWMPAM